MSSKTLLVCSASALIVALTSAQQIPGTPAADRYANASTPPDLNGQRPIAAHDTVFLEEMTWMEVRDAIKSGRNRIIIPTGGIEQNGPYVALGKHNFVLRQECEAIARRLGDTLVAPIVPFVPEGAHSPKTHHMRYPGTISVTEETFERLLIDIANSFKVHDFRHIYLLGDSGDNQLGMNRVAKELSDEWKEHPTQIHYISEYYAPRELVAWLQEHGIEEVDEGLHDRFRYEAVIATLNPEHIRFSQRLREDLTSINGVSLLPFERTKSIGWQLIEFQAQRAVAAIQARSQTANPGLQNN